MNLFNLYSLVLYKGKPAIITAVDDKISIKFENHSKKKVRAKDLIFLSEEPLSDFSFISEKIDGNIELAWELLYSEGTVSVQELAELIFGNKSPAAVWSAYQEIEKKEFFYGNCENVSAFSPEEIEKRKEALLKKKKAEKNWAAYIKRVKTGNIIKDDYPFLKEVELFAFGKTNNSKTLKALGIPQNCDKALILLKNLNIIPDWLNPYFIRNNLKLENNKFSFDSYKLMTNRIDLTHLQCYAIDDFGCSDPDDAISLDGEYIWVHIADPTAVITVNDPIDQQAENCGVSYYFPEKKVPMLPDSINNFFGLGLNETSPALSIKLSVNNQGKPKCEEIVYSIIKAKQISYQDADHISDSDFFQKLTAKIEQFKNLRIQAGGINLNIPEVKIKVKLPPDFQLRNHSYINSFQSKILPYPEIYIEQITNTQSRKLISEIMIMAGNALAEWLYEHNIQVPFVSQTPPENSFKPESLPEMFQLRKQLKRSEIHLTPSFHSGLGLKYYTRVTSPLRRYTDLLVHYQIKAYLNGSEMIDADNMLRKMSYTEEQTQIATKVERLTSLHWKIVYLKQNSDKKYKSIFIEKTGMSGSIFIPELALLAKIQNFKDFIPGEELCCTPVLTSLKPSELYPIFKVL